LTASAGPITPSQFATQAASAIHALTGGPLMPLHTPLSAYVSTTQLFETNLKAVSASLATGASPSLTESQAQTVVNAEAEAYRADMKASLYFHPGIYGQVSGAVDSLETVTAAITTTGSTTPEAQLNAAIAAFDTSVTKIFDEVKEAHSS
jgi:hypothetical protein